MNDKYVKNDPLFTAGIYRIECLRNGRYYIGSSENVRNRIKQHSYLLERGKHTNSRLQEDYSNNYNFVVSVIHPFNNYESKQELIFLEYCYI